MHHQARCVHQAVTRGRFRAVWKEGCRYERMETILEMKGIKKSFSGVEVLHGVDFSIGKGEVVALCGENGAGESTLMKILMGIYTKDAGEITYKGQVLRDQTPQKSLNLGITMIHQELSLVDQLSIAQNVYLGRELRSKAGLVDYKRMNARVQEVMARLQESTPVTTKVGEIKVAQKQLVEIARAISFDCEIIIMDEPTAVLTDRETEVLFETIQRLKADGISIIYISHRLAEIKKICDRVVVLRDGSFVASRDCSTVSEREIAALMVGREIKASTAVPFAGDRNDIVMEVKGVTDRLLKDVSFRIARGEIVGFSGLVGAGRTEVMEYIFGLRKVEKGQIFINGKEVVIDTPVKALKHNIGFATEDRKRSGIVGIRSLKDNINYVFMTKFVRFFLPKKKLDENFAKMREKLRIVCSGEKQLIKRLSGGNQQKVVLARWRLAKSNILILDEPTRGIDVGAREEIYSIIRAMVDAGNTVIVVSSDLPELITVCPRIIVMYEGKVMGELEGDERTEDNLMTLASGLQIAE